MTSCGNSHSDFVKQLEPKSWYLSKARYWWQPRLSSQGVTVQRFYPRSYWDETLFDLVYQLFVPFAEGWQIRSWESCWQSFRIWQSRNTTASSAPSSTTSTTQTPYLQLSFFLRWEFQLTKSINFTDQIHQLHWTNPSNSLIKSTNFTDQIHVFISGPTKTSRPAAATLWSPFQCL